ncbi:MAG: helix-turn-helix domain-containing protein [Candidatus Aminicenantaceae bacterium]
MSREYEQLTINAKMKLLAKELVENELPLRDALREFEKLYILTASKKYNGNKTRMAKALGVHRNTLHNLCKSLELD